jgi:predicted dehydrogenase
MAQQSDKKIRMGVVGGGFGCSFLWHKHPHSTVQAVCDLNPDRRRHMMEHFGCSQGYQTVDELVQDRNVDAVAIFSGAPDHVTHAVAAMRNGKHVISAVPAATTMEDAQLLRETVEQTGLSYMMAETSYYNQTAISARKFYDEGKFGEIFYTEAEYHHAGLEVLWWDTGKPDGKRTWRYGYPPMLYPTHSTGYLVGVTRERMTEVMCLGWGDDSPWLKDNQYGNPFWNESALFKTDRGHAFRVCVFWYGAHRGTERAQWYGTRMSLFMGHPNGLGPIIVRSGEQIETDDAGFERQLSPFEEYQQPEWWQTDMLPEALRVASGHGGAHTFLTHEFIDALVNERPPAINVYEALAMTVPGLVAQQSAQRGGEQMTIPSFDR